VCGRQAGSEAISKRREREERGWEDGVEVIYNGEDCCSMKEEFSGRRKIN
jgi:hypothetical protein